MLQLVRVSQRRQMQVLRLRLEHNHPSEQNSLAGDPDHAPNSAPDDTKLKPNRISGASGVIFSP
jgi:hypothetical protein